jgi:glucose 1-dehydrogenase
MNLSGKQALVTGGGRGIGKGCALELARRGADVVVNDRPGSPDLATTIEEIEGLGRRALGIEGNVFEREGCEQVVAAAIKAFGSLDIFVSNPAYSVRCEFVDYDPDEWQKTLDGTLTSGFNVSQLVARHLIDRGKGGKIVFISSVHAAMPYQRSVAYNACKAGVNHMARTIAAELAPHKINVNAIEPGWIDTPGEHESFDDSAFEQGIPLIPWKRIGLPSDIGKAAAFLASDDADYITGTILRVDGGWVLKDV